MAAVRIAHVAPTGLVSRYDPLEQAVTAQAQGGYLWIDLQSPSRADLQPLAERFGLHPLAVEDCVGGDELPKLEDFPESTFIIFNRFRFQDHELRVEEVDFFLGASFLISVAVQPTGTASERRLEDAIRIEQANIGKGPDYLLHVILDCIVDEKLLAIEALQDDLDRTEELVLEKGSPAFEPSRLIRLRRDLLALRKSLFHGREILVKVCRRDSPFVSEAAIYHFRDIYDHLVKFLEMVEICREMVASLMELHLSVVNNELARLGNRTNQVVRRLTFITTIFMPLSFFAGVGGMSEWSMMTGPQNWRLAYPLFLLVMTLIGVASYYFLRWLDRRPPRRPRPRT